MSGARTFDLQPAVDRLACFVGAEEAEATISACLEQSGVETVATADDLMRVAESLIEHGEVAMLVGRVLRAEALKRGARLP